MVNQTERSDEPTLCQKICGNVWLVLMYGLICQFGRDIFSTVMQVCVIAERCDI